MNLRIVFFDGVCSLCNGFIDFLIRIDKKRRLRYASLQGNTAKKHGIQGSLETMIYWDGKKSYLRSSGVLRLLWDLGGLWKLTAIFYLVPRFIRDAIYNWVAKNRYQWFGQKDVCRMPKPEERAYLLD